MLGAIDIGGSKVAVAAVLREGAVRERRSAPTASLRDPDVAVAQVVAMLRECGGDFEGIGIGCTGPVDPIAGVVGNVDLLPGWSGFPLAARLAGEFGVPVAMENDADAAALAEAEWGAGRGAERFLYISVGTGIGAALLVNGALYRGTRGRHPEPGHHTIDPAGPLCYCGVRGCWESLASGPAMAAAWPGSGGAREICERAAAGDATAAAAVDREAYYLGVGIANLIGILDPDAIALGGGVMESAHLFLPGIRRVVAERTALVPFDTSAIVPAMLGGDAPILGAARVWFHRHGPSLKAHSCA